MNRCGLVLLVLLLFVASFQASTADEDPIDKLREIDYTLRRLEERIEAKVTEDHIETLTIRSEGEEDIEQTTLHEIARDLAKTDGWCSGKDPCAPACKATEEPLKEAMALVCSVRTLRDTVDEELRGRAKLHGEIVFGINGDKTDTRDLFKLNSRIALRSGGYPNEFRASWEAQVRYEDSELDEDVTNASLAFDRYFKQYLEGFLFMERFSDSFLGIDQRYEIGAGLEFEKKNPFCRVTKREEDDEKKTKTCDRRYPTVLTKKKGKDLFEPWRGLDKACVLKVENNNREGDEAVPTEEPAKECEEAKQRKNGDITVDQDALAAKLKALNDDEKLPEEYAKAVAKLIALAEKEQVREAIRNKRAELELGFSVAFFREAERFELESETFDPLTMVTVTETLSSSRTVTRLSLRPSIRIRPSENVELRALVYYKDALEDRGPDTPKDYRIDGLLYAQFKLPKTIFGANVKARFEYEYHHDNDPPTVVEAGALPTLIYAPAVAEDKHNVYKLLVGLEWGG